MRAVIWKHRIDILRADQLPNEKWDGLLDELKAEHVPSATPIGKRLAVVGVSAGGTVAFIYRTSDMPDEQVVEILRKHGIPASIGSEDAAPPPPTKEPGT